MEIYDQLLDEVFENPDGVRALIMGMTNREREDLQTLLMILSEQESVFKIVSEHGQSEHDRIEAVQELLFEVWDEIRRIAVDEIIEEMSCEDEPEVVELADSNGLRLIRGDRVSPARGLWQPPARLRIAPGTQQAHA